MDRITGMPEERIMTGSYRHCDPDDRHITLHDCHAEKMRIVNGEIEGIEIYVFSKNRKGKIIRDEWEPLDMA